MIRINLSPTAKRKVANTRSAGAVQQLVPSTQVSKGGIIAIAMMLGWIAVGVVGYLLLTLPVTYLTYYLEKKFRYES